MWAWCWGGREGHNRQKERGGGQKKGVARSESPRRKNGRAQTQRHNTEGQSRTQRKKDKGGKGEDFGGAANRKEQAGAPAIEKKKEPEG